MTKTIVYLGAPVGFEALQATLPGGHAGVHVAAEPDAVADALTTAHALLDASMKTRITDAMVRNAPDLRIISTATTGSDHIERGVLDERGIPVRTLREDGELLFNLTPAAELSWALVLAAARRLPAAVTHVRDGLWVREEFPGVMLNGKRMGIVGCGRIGSWMARYATAFGMEVVGHDPHRDELPDGIRRMELAQLVATADVLSVHVHLTDETRGLLSASLLGQCKPGLILVNTSRGAVVDEAALLEGLENGRIGAAGLDVLDGEPEIERHPLVAYAREHDNLLITPHCGGFSPDAVWIVCRRAAEKIVEALADA